MSSSIKSMQMHSMFEHSAPSPKKPYQATTPSSNNGISLSKNIQSSASNQVASNPQSHPFQQQQQQLLNFNYLTINQSEIPSNLSRIGQVQPAHQQGNAGNQGYSFNNTNNNINNNTNNCKLTDILSTRYSSGTLKFMRGVQAPPPPPAAAANSPFARQLSSETKQIIDSRPLEKGGYSPTHFQNAGASIYRQNPVKQRDSVSSSSQQNLQQQQNSFSPRTFSLTVQDKMMSSKLQTNSKSSQNSKKDKESSQVAVSAAAPIPKRQKSLKALDAENEHTNNQQNLASSVTVSSRNLSEKNLTKQTQISVFSANHNNNGPSHGMSLQSSYNFSSSSSNPNSNHLTSSVQPNQSHQTFLQNISNNNNGNLPLSHYHIQNQQSFGLPVNSEPISLASSMKAPQMVIPSNNIISALSSSSISSTVLPGRFESFGVSGGVGRAFGVSQSLEKFKTTGQSSVLLQQQKQTLPSENQTFQKQGDLLQQQHLHQQNPQGNYKSNSKKTTSINDQQKGRNNKKLPTNTLTQSSANLRTSQQFSSNASPHSTQQKQSTTSTGTTHSSVIAQLLQNGTQLSKSAALSAISQRIQQNLNSLGDHNQYQPLQGSYNSLANAAGRMHTEYISSRESDNRDASIGFKNTRTCASRNSLSDNFKISQNSLEFHPGMEQIQKYQPSGVSASSVVTRKNGIADNISGKQPCQHQHNDITQKNCHIHGPAENSQKNGQHVYFMKDKERLALKKKKGEISSKLRKTEKSTPHSSNTSVYNGQQYMSVNESGNVNQSSTQGQRSKINNNQNNSSPLYKSLAHLSIPTHSNINNENNQIISRYIQRHTGVGQSTQEDRILEHYTPSKRSEEMIKDFQDNNQIISQHEKRNSLQIFRKSESYFGDLKDIQHGNNNINGDIQHKLEDIPKGYNNQGEVNFYSYQIGNKQVEGNNSDVNYNISVLSNNNKSPNNSNVQYTQQHKNITNNLIRDQLPQQSNGILDHSAISSSSNCQNDKTKYFQTLFSQLFVRESDRKQESAPNELSANQNQLMFHEVIQNNIDQEQLNNNNHKGHDQDDQNNDDFSPQINSFRDHCVFPANIAGQPQEDHADKSQSCEISLGLQQQQKLSSECQSRQSFNPSQDLLFQNAIYNNSAIKSANSMKTSGRTSPHQQGMQVRDSHSSAVLGGTVVYSLDSSLINHPIIPQQSIPIQLAFSDYQEELCSLKKASTSILDKYKQKLQFHNEFINDQKKKLTDFQDTSNAKDTEISKLKQKLSDLMKEKQDAEEKSDMYFKQLQIAEKQLQTQKQEIQRLTQQLNEQQQSPKITRQPNPIVLSPKVIKKAKGGGWGCSAQKKNNNNTAAFTGGKGIYSMPTFSKEMLGRASTDASSDNKPTDCSLEMLKKKYQISTHKTKFTFTPASSTSSGQPSGKNQYNNENPNKIGFNGINNNYQSSVKDQMDIQMEEQLNDSFQMLKQISQSKKSQGFQNTSGAKHLVQFNQQPQSSQQGLIQVNSFSDLPQNLDNNFDNNDQEYQQQEQIVADNEDELSNRCFFGGNQQGSFNDLAGLLPAGQQEQYDGGHFGFIENNSFNGGQQQDNNESFGKNPDEKNNLEEEQSSFRATENQGINGQKRDGNEVDILKNQENSWNQSKNLNNNDSFSNENNQKQLLNDSFQELGNEDQGQIFQSSFADLRDEKDRQSYNNNTNNHLQQEIAYSQQQQSSEEKELPGLVETNIHNENVQRFCHLQAEQLFESQNQKQKESQNKYELSSCSEQSMQNKQHKKLQEQQYSQLEKDQQACAFGNVSFSQEQEAEGNGNLMDSQEQKQQELSFEENSAGCQNSEQKQEGEEERDQNISFANQSFGG